MKLQKTFCLLVILFAFSHVVFGQEYFEDENWLKGFQTEADKFPVLYYQFERFTKEDVAKGKQRLNLIRQFEPKTEWEGIYYRETGIGDAKLIWNARGGFFSFYFYHELKVFDFGTVIDNPDFIELFFEKPTFINPVAKTKLIKVKFGERRFLVPEKNLLDFCEKAAGLSTDYRVVEYYHTKVEDMGKKVFGLPVLPEKYKYLLRYPIETKIVRAGSRKIVPSKFDRLYKEVVYSITINAGINKNVKSGMNFFVEDLGEWIEITKVLPNSSIGLIRRDFYDNKEKCRNSEQEEIVPCKKVKVGLKAKTKISEYSF